MERQVLFCHRTDRRHILKESFKICSNVNRATFVSIDRDHAVSLCAAPQTPNLLSHLLLHGEGGVVHSLSNEVFNVVQGNRISVPVGESHKVVKPVT